MPMRMQVTRRSPQAPDSLSRLRRTAEAAYDPNGWNSRVSPHVWVR
jgi:hypothetical protein